MDSSRRLCVCVPVFSKTNRQAFGAKKMNSIIVILVNNPYNLPQISPFGSLLPFVTFVSSYPGTYPTKCPVV